MQFNITGKHLEITPAMHEYVSEIFKEIEEAFAFVTSSQVTLSTEKHEKLAEATLMVSGHPNVHGDARHEDMYIAIDQLKHRLVTQLLKIKEKNDHH